MVPDATNLSDIVIEDCCFLLAYLFVRFQERRPGLAWGALALSSSCELNVYALKWPIDYLWEPLFSNLE